MLRNVFSIILLVLNFQIVSAGTRGVFTDESLRVLLEHSAHNQTAGVIYTWSPRMPISIMGVKDMVKIVEDLDLEMTVVLDPNISDEEADSAQYAAIHDLKISSRAQSLDLYKMGIRVHYPALIVYKNGEIRDYIRPGYDEPGRAKSIILRSLQ